MALSYEDSLALDKPFVFNLRIRVKSWGRGKKIALIESVNRYWKDLSAAWYGGSGELPPRRTKQEPRRDSSLRSE
jgi:hypothetical protein